MGFPVLIGIRPGASEDVSFFLNEVPGLYFNLGIVPRDQDLPKAAPTHSPGGALLALYARLGVVRQPRRPLG